MKSLLQKLLVAGLLGVLAFAVWTQRGALQDCADKVQANYATVGHDRHGVRHRVLLLRSVDHDLGPPLGVTTLARLTGAKTVANTALRWIPLFLPTLEGAFGATTTTDDDRASVSANWRGSRRSRRVPDSTKGASAS